jgi:hypothetical protein
LFDDFIERSHSWNHHYYLKRTKKEVPYTKPWVGIFHIPQNSPDWYDFCHNPQAILKRETFQKSLEKCLGLFSLTDYLSDFLRKNVDVPVETLRYPTYLNPVKWTEQGFLSNKDKKIIQLGCFLRRSYAIIRLKSDYHKVWFCGDFKFSKHYQKLEESMSEDWGYLSQKMHSQVWVPEDRVEDKTFDEYMSKNILFVNLFDTSANTAVVESIARDAPLVINRLEGAEEYLGKDYPLFYDDFDEASRIINDTDKILEAHYYLKNMDKNFLEAGEFCSSVRRNVKKWLHQ